VALSVLSSNNFGVNITSESDSESVSILIDFGLPFEINLANFLSLSSLSFLSFSSFISRVLIFIAKLSILTDFMLNY
jgi:hypothetical protein